MRRLQDLVPQKKMTRKQQAAIHQTQHSTPALPANEEMELSAFERLPTEIIQHIFFLSLEPSLTATSRTFNAVLSDEAVFRTFLLFAYFEPQDDMPVEEKHFLPAEYRYLNSQERKELQRTIWKFRWCNRARIDSCLPILRRLVTVQVWHEESERRSQHSKDPTKPANTALLLQSKVPLPDLNDEKALRRFFRVPKDLDSQGTLEYSKWAMFRAYNSPHRLKAIATPTVPVLAVLMAPHTLLCGSPWTNEKYHLLRILFVAAYKRTRERVNIIDADTQNSLFHGMESAIVDKRADILRFLLKLWAMERGSKGSRYTILKPPRTLIRTAMKLGPGASEYLACLFAHHSINPYGQYEEELTGWALQAKARGDILGDWILEALDSPPDERFEPFWPERKDYVKYLAKAQT